LSIQNPQVPRRATTVAVTTVRVSIRRVINESYPVVIGENLAPTIAERLFEPDLVSHQAAIITDENVRAGLAETIRSELAERGRRAHVVEFPAGERYKTRQTKATVEDALIEAGCGRDTCILAVGGGVVTDMAGFVAATLARGVPFVNVPTTILAAADASIGGKTGVDTAGATNLIGAVHQPRAVYIDLATWRTLPTEQIQSGLAETIKHACLADKYFFALLEKVFVDQGRAPEELVQDDELMRQIAQHNSEIKARFVTGDVHESNVRMALNLGHTFGRALEAAEDYTHQPWSGCDDRSDASGPVGGRAGVRHGGGGRSPQATARVRRSANGVASQHDQRTARRQDAARQEDSRRGGPVRVPKGDRRHPDIRERLSRQACWQRGDLEVPRPSAPVEHRCPVTDGVIRAVR
jgi:3-dehydroquinate synthase